MFGTCENYDGSKISIKKLNFLLKLPLLKQTFDFWLKFGFLNKICIFDQNFDC